MTTGPSRRRASPTRKRPAGITAVTISGYKSLARETTLAIRPLTILAGANSSGKSSAMQPLLLLKQTLETTYDPGALLLDGPNVRFTSAEQFLSRPRRRQNPDQFAISIEVDGSQRLTNTFQKRPKLGIELIETSLDFGGSKPVSLRPDMNLADIMANVEPGLGIPKDFLTTFSRHGDEDASWRVARDRCFLTLELVSKGAAIQWPLMAAGQFDMRVRELIHVPGLRGNPARAYKTTAIGTTFPGTFENYVASVVNHWQSTEDPRFYQLADALLALGLTSKIAARQIDDTQVELRVGRLPGASRGRSSDVVSIADVGFGVSQVLPVPVALLAATPGQLVYIEQPEIHLHPRAQSAMAGVLAAAANRGVRVVAETHSNLLLLGLQALVAEGSVAKDLVKLHWFTRRADGCTVVNSADLDRTGAFGEWPEDFGEVAFEAQNRYLSAAESRLFGASRVG